jgi:hypothetical protein
VVGPLDPGHDPDPQFLAGTPGPPVEDVFLRNEKNDSMAALSAAEATWPIEPTRP